MASRWLLDTSALLALRDNEAGAERAAAIKEGAVLVHKDPEFQAIRSLAQEWLG
jgi:predicted nucleic acid-binding protein